MPGARPMMRQGQQMQQGMPGVRPMLPGRQLGGPGQPTTAPMGMAGGPMGRFAGNQAAAAAMALTQQQMLAVAGLRGAQGFPAGPAAAAAAALQGRLPGMQQGFMAPMRSSVVPTGGSGDEPLTLQRLADAQPREQKQMLGDRLYPLVARINTHLAGKITGMLLELDNAELLHLLESEELLRDKVEEAVQVWQQHSEVPPQQASSTGAEQSETEAPSAAEAPAAPVPVAAN